MFLHRFLRRVRRRLSVRLVDLTGTITYDQASPDSPRLIEMRAIRLNRQGWRSMVHRATGSHLYGVTCTMALAFPTTLVDMPNSDRQLVSFGLV